MAKTETEITDAYRASRRNVSIASGLALGWTSAQFEISTANLPLVGDVALSRYSIPILLATALAYLAVRSTLEFMMQPVPVRQWRLAQADYQITLAMAAVSIPLLAASGVSRSLETVALVIGMGLLLAAAFVATTSMLVVLIMVLNLFVCARRVEHPSVATAAIESTHYALLLSGTGLLFVISWGGNRVLSWGYGIVGLTEPPPSIPVAIFLLTCVLFTIGCFFVRGFLQKVFAFQPPYLVKSEKQEGGVVGVSFIPNPESNNKPEDIRQPADGLPKSSA